MATARVDAIVGADVTPLERAFRKAEGSGAKFAASLKSKLAAAFSIGAVVAFTRSLSQTAASIKDVAAQMQIGTEDAQKLQFEFGLIGLKGDLLVTTFLKIGAARQKALAGDIKSRDAFASLRVSMEDLNSAAVQNIDIMQKLGNALNQGGSPNDFATLFGAEGVRAMEAFKAFAKGSTAPIISEEGIESIDRATKTLERLQLQGKGFFAGIVNGIQAALEEVAFGFTQTPRRNRIVDTENFGALPFPALQTPEGPASIFPSQSGQKGFEEVQRTILKRQEASRKLEFEKLDATGKRLMLEKEIANLTAQGNLTADEAASNDLLRQAAEKELELLRLTGSAGRTPPSDALARIGGVTGGNGGLQDIAKQQLKAAKDQVTAQDETNRILRE